MAKAYLDVVWKTGTSCIGIVIRNTGFGLRAYMLNVEGIDKEKDIQRIMDYGIKLTEREALGFFPRYAGQKFTR